MRFVVISDTHCQHKKLLLPAGDVLIHAGDISSRGSLPEVLDFLQWFSKQDFKYKIFIAGNHDYFFERAEKEAIEAVTPENIIYLNDNFTIIENIKIWGSPITPKFFNWAFNRKRGEAIKKHWDLIPADTDIVIAHGPAYGVLDKTIHDEHVGCKDLLNTLLEIKPKIFISGHIHEDYGIIEKHGIQFVNASVLDEYYEMVNSPIILDF